MTGRQRRDPQEDRLTFALDAADLGVWDWDIPSGTVWWSDNLAAVHGVAPDRFDGTFAGFLSLVHPDDRDALREAVEDAVGSGTDFAVEFRVEGDDGIVRWVSGKGRVAADADGVATRMLGIGADITARKHAEARDQLLARAGEVLSASLDFATNVEEAVRLAVPVLADWCVVDILDDDGRLHRAAIVHRDPARAADTEALRRRYPVLDRDVPHTIWRVLETGQPWLDPRVDRQRFETEARDPEHRGLLERLGFASEMVVPLVARGRVLGALTFAIGAPERRYGTDDLAFAAEFGRRCAYALDNARLYREARTAEARLAFLAAASADLAGSLDLRTTLESLAKSVVPTLADWCVIDVRTESGFERLAAVHRDPALAEVTDELRRRFPPDPTAGGGVGRAIRTGEVAFHPVVSEDLADATARHDPDLRRLLDRLGLDSYIIVPLIAREQILGTVSLVFSMSGRRYDEDHLAVAQELARRAAMAVDNARLHREAQDAITYRDEFLALAAHDLKGPLTVIQGRAQVLNRWVARLESADGERLSRGLRDIESTVTRMSRLIAELQDQAATQTGRDLDLDRRPTDLVRLVAEEVALIGPTAAGHEIVFQPSVAGLVADVDAVRFGRVVANLLGNAIKYSPDGGEIQVTLDREDETASVLVVRDRGLGIPASELPRIFDRYHRGGNVVGRITGSGLGLAGARQIVEQHGGRIEVSSEEGRGSTFTVRVPVAAAAGP